MKIHFVVVWHAGCSMGELTARDEDKIRVSDNRSNSNVGTLLWKKLGQINNA